MAEAFLDIDPRTLSVDEARALEGDAKENALALGFEKWWNSFESKDGGSRCVVETGKGVSPATAALCEALSFGGSKTARSDNDGMLMMIAFFFSLSWARNAKKPPALAGLELHAPERFGSGRTQFRDAKQKEAFKKAALCCIRDFAARGLLPSRYENNFDFGSCRGKTVLHMVWSLSVASLDGELQKYPFANVERATVTLNRASDMGYSGPELHNVLELASLYEAKRFEARCADALREEARWKGTHKHLCGKKDKLDLQRQALLDRIAGLVKDQEENRSEPILSLPLNANSLASKHLLRDAVKLKHLLDACDDCSVRTVRSLESDCGALASLSYAFDASGSSIRDACNDIADEFSSRSRILSEIWRSVQSQNTIAKALHARLCRIERKSRKEQHLSGDDSEKKSEVVSSNAEKEEQLPRPKMHADGVMFEIPKLTKSALFSAVSRAFASGLITKTEKRVYKDEIIACKDDETMRTLASKILQRCIE